MPRSRFPPAGRYQLSDRYCLDSWIAAGGVGEVWRAVDTVLDRAVAIKLLREEFVQDAQARARFRAEAKHAGALSHPGIAQVYDYAESDPEVPPFLVMELVEGPSLAAVLARGPLDPGRAMDVVAQTAAGLEAAHWAGLIHRDIKPANLLLTPAGQVKITDFGIAYAAGSAPLTRTGLLVGTPAYLAPERAMGASATTASDLYSLGIVAFECLTGTAPFTGVPLEVATAHRHAPLPPLPATVPPQVRALVQTLTSKDPAGRPSKAGEVADRAAQLRDSLPSAPATSDPLAARAPSPLAAPVSGAEALSVSQRRLLADTGDGPLAGHANGVLDNPPAASPPEFPSGRSPSPLDDPLAARASGWPGGGSPAWSPGGRSDWPAGDPLGLGGDGAAANSRAQASTSSSDAETPSAARPTTVAYARPGRFAPPEPSRYSGRHASRGPTRPPDTLAYVEPPGADGGYGAETLPPGSLPPAGPSSRRPIALGPRAQMAAAAAAVVLLAAAAIWLFSGSHSRTPAGHNSSPRPTHSAGRAGLVRVSPHLAGHPVRVVARELRALGLRVQIVRRPDFEVPAGIVLRISPTGRVRPDTLITLTVARAAGQRPPGNGNGHAGNGNGHGGGNGNGNGNGHGND